MSHLAEGVRPRGGRLKNAEAAAGSAEQAVGIRRRILNPSWKQQYRSSIEGGEENEAEKNEGPSTEERGRSHERGHEKVNLA